VAGYLQDAAQGFANVNVLELGDLVCPNRRCAAQTLGGIAVFRDRRHVTASFARSLVPEMRARLQSLGVRTE